MKKFATILFLATALVFTVDSYGRSITSINEKVIRSFKETFPQAEKVNWEEFSDRYIVHFEDGKIRTVVDYDKDGNYLGSKRYYTEEFLPVTVICKLRKKYAGKKVFGVTEVANDSGTDYYIKMEDENNWTTVKSDINGYMETVEKYQKQP